MGEGGSFRRAGEFRPGRTCMIPMLTASHGPVSAHKGPRPGGLIIFPFLPLLVSSVWSLQHSPRTPLFSPAFLHPFFSAQRVHQEEGRPQRVRRQSRRTRWRCSPQNVRHRTKTEKPGMCVRVGFSSWKRFRYGPFQSAFLGILYGGTRLNIFFSTVCGQ